MKKIIAICFSIALSLTVQGQTLQFSHLTTTPDGTPVNGLSVTNGIMTDTLTATNSDVISSNTTTGGRAVLSGLNGLVVTNGTDHTVVIVNDGTIISPNGSFGTVSGSMSGAFTGTLNATGGNIATNNAEAMVFTNGSYFVQGTWFQTNSFSVIQACIDRLPYYSTKYRVGGGEILFQPGAIYDLTNTIILTNNNVASWKFTGQGNNCSFIKANGNYSILSMNSVSTNDANLNFDAESIAFVNATNCQTNLIYLNHESKCLIHNCIFADWCAWTNNGFGISSLGTLGLQPGLSTAVPIYPSGLIGIFADGSQGDRLKISFCNFDALAVAFESHVDHAEIDHCDFQCCSYWSSNGVSLWGNSWTNKSWYSTGWQVGGIDGIAPVVEDSDYYYSTEGAEMNYVYVRGNIGDEGLLWHSAVSTNSPNAIAPFFENSLVQAGFVARTLMTNTSGVWLITNQIPDGSDIPTVDIWAGFNPFNVTINGDIVFGTVSTDGTETAIAGFRNSDGTLFGTGTNLTRLPANQLYGGITQPLNGIGLTNISLPYRAGTTNIANLALGTTVIVKFSTPFLPTVSSNYAIAINPSSAISLAASVYTSAKTTNGFTENVIGISTGAFTNDYTAWPYQ